MLVFKQNSYSGIGWYQFLKQWLKLIPEAGRFKSVEGGIGGVLRGYDIMSGRLP
jgi:hypothetical protein